MLYIRLKNAAYLLLPIIFIKQSAAYSLSSLSLQFSKFFNPSLTLPDISGRNQVEGSCIIPDGENTCKVVFVISAIQRDTNNELRLFNTSIFYSPDGTVYPVNLYSTQPFIFRSGTAKFVRY